MVWLVRLYIRRIPRRQRSYARTDLRAYHLASNAEFVRISEKENNVANASLVSASEYTSFQMIKMDMKVVLWLISHDDISVSLLGVMWFGSTLEEHT